MSYAQRGKRKKTWHSVRMIYRLDDTGKKGLNVLQRHETADRRIIDMYMLFIVLQTFHIPKELLDISSDHEILIHEFIFFYPMMNAIF